MHIALFGGSFDPPHNSHLRVAKEVLKDLPEVDEVWLLPDNQHDWKTLEASPQDRLKMLKNLEHDRIKVSDIAVQRGGKTITLDIIKHLQATTLHTYVWICGADQLETFPLWGDDIRELEEKLTFIIYPRIGYDIPKVLPKHSIVMHPVDFIATDDSSTEIRKRVKDGLPISELMPKEIEEYIREHELYK